MKIIKISLRVLKDAAEVLKHGGVLVYPTDTAYALGADPINRKAVSKIYKIKGRAKSKALPLIAVSPEMIKKFFKVGVTEEKLINKYWPGPLSIVLETDSKFQIPNSRFLAVRVPKSKIARELSRLFGQPIISTSANVSGMGECYSAREVVRQFKNRKHKPDLILDGGRLQKRKPSTIVKVTKKEIEVLRQGPIVVKI